MPDENTQTVPDGSGAVSPPASFDSSDPAVQAFLHQAIDNATKEIRQEIKGFRDTNVALKKEVEGYKSIGMEPDDLKRIVENINKNEEAKLIAEGKFEDVLNMRVEPLRRDYETRLNAAAQKTDELTERLQALQEENYDLRVTHQVAAHVPADANDGALPIFIEWARKTWKRDNEGNMVPRRDNGTRWISKDGKSDIGFTEWFDTLRDTMPFLFRSPNGMPARGGNASGTHKPWEGKTGVSKLTAFYESTAGR